jgi:hypothetical protein
MLISGKPEIGGRRVTDPDNGFAFMAIRAGELIGTLGAIFVKWW